MTIGSDPEFFLFEEQQVISAIGVVPGSKYHRYRHKDCYYYYDNVLAECAFSPATSKKEFIANLRACLQFYTELIKPYRLSVRACELFRDEQLKGKGREFVCADEWCAYTKKLVENDSAEKMTRYGNYRSAGGHIHLGDAFLKNKDNAVKIVKMLDVFLGIPLLLISKDVSASQRRKIFGKAGRFRTPAYGIEYRTPDNYWLSSPRLAGLVYDICEFALNFAKSDLMIWSSDIKGAINRNDVAAAAKLLKFAFVYLPENLRNDIKREIACDALDFYKEWQFK